MRTIRYTFLCIFIFFSGYIDAQTDNKKKTFLRVYNLEGKKIAKGNFTFANDSILILKKVDDSYSVRREDIGHIRTKHSAGNNVLTGAVAGSSVFAVLGAASADPDAWIFSYTKAEGAAMGGIVGGFGGAAIGGVTALFKKQKTFIINGELERWNTFIKLIQMPQ